MNNFWDTLPNKFTVLAPMDAVTDVVFRQIVASVGRPDVFFTEFTSVDAMMSKKGRIKTENERLRFEKSEYPIVAQIYGTDPDKFLKTASIILGLGFDGVDINMGCPVRKVIKRGSCSGLIRNPKLAGEIIAATKEGVAGKIPVSVKTRIGLNKIVTDEWIPFLLEQKIDALTVHARTAKEESKVAAHWEEFGKAVRFKDQISPKTKIIANGDIKTQQDAQTVFEMYVVDGIMIGRGIFENPWVFNKEKNPESITPKDKMELLIRHIELFDKTWGSAKHFPIMRKFVKAYVNGFSGASDIRAGLMETETAEELKNLVLKFLLKYGRQL